VKPIRRHAELALAALLAVTGTVLVAATGEAQPESSLPQGFVRLLELHDANGAPQGSLLQAVDWLEDRKLERWLVTTPSGEHLVISEERLPLEGRSRVRIQHEESGWFAELEERSGMKLERVDEMGNPLAVVEELSKGKLPRTVVLRASSLAEPFEFSSTTWDDDFLDKFFWLFEARAPAEGFAESIDARAVDALRFLRTVAGCESCAFSAGKAGVLLDFVTRSLEEHDLLGVADEQTAGWTVEPAAVVRRASEDPRVLEVLATFRSVPQPDPLADLRP